MLKETLILGLLAPLLFKARTSVADNDARIEPELPPLQFVETPSVATDVAASAADEIPWPELPHMRTPKAAVREFLDEMIDACGGETLRFSRLSASYESIRKGRMRSDACVGYAPRPWPPIKDRTLSQLLCAAGCVREQRDHRAIDGTRPTYITFPADAADEFDAEPELLAA
jgi:hypothetical protein